MTVPSRDPVYPLTVAFQDDEPLVLGAPEDAETEFEFFDSEDPAELTPVTDAHGRPVHLVAYALRVTCCELK